MRDLQRAQHWDGPQGERGDMHRGMNEGRGQAEGQVTVQYRLPCLIMSAFSKCLPSMGCFWALLQAVG